MSPEQARGEGLDARSDVFALGCVLYEALAGVRCFGRATHAETLAAILKEDPPPVSGLHLGLPAEVARTVHLCLEKDRVRRFQSAREVAIALRTPATLPAPAPPAAEPAPAIASLAVLPFASVGSDPETEYLADGVTENLINVLSRLRGLRVVPRTTAFRFRGRESEPEAVGRELKVGAILSGKVVQRGDGLSVQAELVEAAQGAQLWGERYRRKLADLFDVEEELAREIAERLQVHLSGQGRERIEQRRRGDGEAYRLYLQGRYQWNKRTPQGMEQALDDFERAAARDPGFALAHAGIADCYTQLSHFGWLAPSQGYPRARAAALKALELQPELSEARAALAHTRACHDWDWTGAEADFRRALQQDPGYATGRYWYGFYLLTPLGRFEEAAREMERALEQEPLSLAIGTYLGTASYLARWYERAIAQARAVLALEPRFPQALWCLAMALQMRGRSPEALAELGKALEVSPWSQWVLGGLGYALAAAGRHGEAREVLARMQERSRTRHVSPYLRAYVHVGLGEREAALAQLQQAVEARADTLVFVKVDPVFDPLRSEPRFVDIVRRVGLLG
jgi:serine/threonine-protein kinase